MRVCRAVWRAGGAEREGGGRERRGVVGSTYSRIICAICSVSCPVGEFSYLTTSTAGVWNKSGSDREDAMLPERLLGRPRRCAHRVLRPPFALGRPHSHMCRLLPSPPSPPRVGPGCIPDASCPRRAPHVVMLRHVLLLELGGSAGQEPQGPSRGHQYPYQYPSLVHAHEHACSGRTAPAAGVFRCTAALNELVRFVSMLPGQPPTSAAAVRVGGRGRSSPSHTRSVGSLW
jgi:hypothetical protein